VCLFGQNGSRGHKGESKRNIPSTSEQVLLSCRSRPKKLWAIHLYPSVYGSRTSSYTLYHTFWLGIQTQTDGQGKAIPVETAGGDAMVCTAIHTFFHTDSCRRTGARLARTLRA